MKKILLAALAAAAAGLWVSCQEPVPLYGTWADNQGNTLAFFVDNTFSGKVDDTLYEGNYQVLLNAITFDVREPSQRLVSEWDIRGNMLYLDWTTSDGAAKNLTLYKVGN
ncbi:MAG: hypothetical protein LBR16_00195 [Treponema sp.]|nr:hypothetical protein [Treponema sp.]